VFGFRDVMFYSFFIIYRDFEWLTMFIFGVAFKGGFLCKKQLYV